MNPSPTPAYFDYAATTPVDPVVIAKMHTCLGADGLFGNPSSMHGHGWPVRSAIEEATREVALVLDCRPSEVYFTSGATESCNLVIKGILPLSYNRAPRHVITSLIEHKAVLQPCEYLEANGVEVTYLKPNRDGVITPEAVADALRPHTALISLIHTNNEIGVIQSAREIGSIARKSGIPLHWDASQSVGKIPVHVGDFGASFVSFSAHKFYGPKGIGGLFVEEQMQQVMVPLMHGGGQQKGIRPGTLPTHQIVGLGAAAQVARARMKQDWEHVVGLRELFLSKMSSLERFRLNGGRLGTPGIINFTLKGLTSKHVMKRLPKFSFSSGSACSSTSSAPSHVLRAIGLDDETASNSLRISLGRYTQEADVRRLIEELSRL